RLDRLRGALPRRDVVGAAARAEEQRDDGQKQGSAHHGSRCSRTDGLPDQTKAQRADRPERRGFGRGTGPVALLGVPRGRRGAGGGGGGWGASRGDVPGEDPEPILLFYCPSCAEREFGGPFAARREVQQLVRTLWTTAESSGAVRRGRGRTVGRLLRELF